MADLFLLVTAADVELRKTDAPLTGWLEDPYGVSAVADHVALISFQGVPSNRMQQQTQVERRMALALPDLVQLRNGLDALIRSAVDSDLLRLPHSHLRDELAAALGPGNDDTAGYAQADVALDILRHARLGPLS